MPAMHHAPRCTDRTSAISIALLSRRVSDPRKCLHFEFRTEIFNLTNTPNFGVPNAALGTNDFGSVSGDAPYYTPREIQFALKLLF